MAKPVIYGLTPKQAAWLSKMPIAERVALLKLWVSQRDGKRVDSDS